MKPIISIGVLAYNESLLIQKTLQSLLQQNLFNQYSTYANIEIIVVPNGCTDDTAVIAQSMLEKLVNAIAYPNIQWRVCSLLQAGKVNAWNTYVHQLSNPNAKYLFLMDADIEFLDSSTLCSMIEVLEKKDEAWISVDRPIKDVTLKHNKSFMENLSVLASSLSGGSAVEEGPAWICGQLYCARAERLRQIWIPTKLPVEDGFLYTMVTTEHLRSPAIPQRVILAKSASHAFEAHTQFARVLRHEKWLILANAINEIIYQDIRDLRDEDLRDESDIEQHPGVLIRRWDEENPEWVADCIKKATLTKGWWLIPKFIMIRRFKSLQYKQVWKLIPLVPLSVCAFLIDFVLSVQANAELHKGSKMGYWGK